MKLPTLLLLLLSGLGYVHGSGLLYPRPSETREVKTLDGIWQFRISPTNDSNIGFKQKWYARSLEQSGGEILMMPVPSSYNDVTTRADIRDFVGWAWYERTFFVPAAWLQQDSKVRIMLRFGSVHYTAKVVRTPFWLNFSFYIKQVSLLDQEHAGPIDVYRLPFGIRTITWTNSKILVNGKPFYFRGFGRHEDLNWVNSQLAMEHIGGHLPFEADVTSLLHRSANRLTVAVSNVLDPHTIPQGQVERPNDAGRYPPGYVINSYTFDFYNYAGIHRPVVLHAVPNSHVDNILVTSSIQNKQDGVVKFDINVKNKTALPLSCKVRILDSNGLEKIASDPMPIKKCAGSLLVSLLDQEHEGPIDVYRLPFGIRTITWTNSKILVNGKPFYFRGFGRHEDLNVRGKGLDLVMLVKDHNLMQWLGANSYRTSHYPYSEEDLDLSDRLGLVVISESPAVDLVVFDKPLLERHRTVMYELIRRDKNRACVLMWSLANEARTQQPASEAYFKYLATYVKYLDPTRPITMAINRAYNEDHGAAFMDVIALNQYFAWYSNTGRLELIARQVENDIRHWKKVHNKPIFVAEYGADAVAGLHSDPPSIWTEDYQVALMKENFKAFDKLREQGLLNGEMIWNFADFATAQGHTRVNGNKKGIFTRERQPKAAAHELKRRYHSLAKDIDQYYVQKK
ncbi:hypothetical protein B566_EDAN008762 [Ephemera danica]|nr:hypothetical protein B566_EDAN008762 [Ephemera danica]